MPKTSMLQSFVMFLVDEVVTKPKRIVKKRVGLHEAGRFTRSSSAAGSPKLADPVSCNLVPHFALYDKN